MYVQIYILFYNDYIKKYSGKNFIDLPTKVIAYICCNFVNGIKT